MTTAPAAHVVAGTDSARCLHCGHEQKIAFPCSIPVYAAIAEAFAGEHADCEPSDAGKVRFDYATVLAWRSSWDTGISSLTIYSVFTGSPLPAPGADVPHDPADFGRCHRLLKIAPEWRADLQRVAESHPKWAPLVEAWGELEALYEEEAPTGQAPKLYDRMKELAR